MISFKQSSALDNISIFSPITKKIAGTSSETDVEPHIIRIFAESAAETQELENKRFMKIQDEGREKRKNAEVELQRLETEMREKLLEISRKN